MAVKNIFPDSIALYNFVVMCIFVGLALFISWVKPTVYTLTNALILALGVWYCYNEWVKRLDYGQGTEEN